MRVQLLKKSPTVYSCNSYLVRGDWNTISDVNTLIDVGTDDYILDEIETISTGAGKSRVEQVILTHEHFDHKAGLSHIIKTYSPRVIAFSKFEGVTDLAHGEMKVKIGDKSAIIIHTPGHSNDSICIYSPEAKALFCGDTMLNIKTSIGSYSREFLDILARFKKFDIQTIYSGHDDPIENNANEIISQSWQCVKNSNITD